MNKKEKESGIEEISFTMSGLNLQHKDCPILKEVSFHFLLFDEFSRNEWVIN